MQHIDLEKLSKEERFRGLDLKYYYERIPREQFELLLDSVGIYPASPGFDATKIDVYYEEAHEKTV